MSDYHSQSNNLGLVSNSLGLRRNEEAANELQGLSFDSNGNFPMQSDFLGCGINYDVFSHNFTKSSTMDDEPFAMNNMVSSYALQNRYIQRS